MKISRLQRNKHLLYRAGFGPALSQVGTITQQEPTALWQHLLGQQTVEPITIEDPVVIDFSDYAKLDAATKKAIQERSRQQNIQLNLSFFEKMVNSPSQLLEKMAFFWHGHFAARIVNPKYNAQLLNTLRNNALGNFKDLLKAASQSPAMLEFLNNQQNKKGHPNENFAREVMELFTMGRGNYTEKDVREAARAFTGWAYDKSGTFLQKPTTHDTGQKTFLGQTGNFDGEQILDIILQQKATAHFIAAKLYNFFVNGTPNPKIISTLGDSFYNSGYDIKTLLTSIFTAEWFYSTENIGIQIKSPIQLMAGIMRILPMKIDQPENLIIYQKLLGQMLLYPPNVAGWPTGKAWIDSSTLMLRMQMPQIWSGLRPLDYHPKADDDLDMGMKTTTAKNTPFSLKNPGIKIEWPRIEEAFAKVNPTDILLQCKVPDTEILKNFGDGGIKAKIINLMSTPEYQLC